MTANETQIGGTHYRDMAVQPWDYMRECMSAEAFTGYLQGCCIKYLSRFHKKGGVEDLRKARHYLDKLIETLDAQPNPEHVMAFTGTYTFHSGTPADYVVTRTDGPGIPGAVTYVCHGESLDDAAKRATAATNPREENICGVCLRTISGHLLARCEECKAAPAADWPGPDWSQAPEWARWWAVDGWNSQANWYYFEPFQSDGSENWQYGGGDRSPPVGVPESVKSPDFGYTGDWRDSLRKRPETPKCEHRVTANNLIGALTNTGWHCRDCGMHADDIRKQQQGK